MQLSECVVGSVGVPCEPQLRRPFGKLPAALSHSPQSYWEYLSASEDHGEIRKELFAEQELEQAYRSR